MRILRRVAAAITVVAAVAVAGLFIVIPRVTGGAALTVLTGSMTPSIPAGSIVLVVPTAPAAVRPGDVITFQSAPGVAEYVTHRVVRVRPNADPPSLITKGDANRGNDIDPVPFGAVRGEVRLAVPFIGRATQVVRTRTGFVALAVPVALALIAAQVRSIASELRKKREDPEVAAEDGALLAPADSL